MRFIGALLAMAAAIYIIWVSPEFRWFTSQEHPLQLTVATVEAKSRPFGNKGSFPAGYDVKLTSSDGEWSSVVMREVQVGESLTGICFAGGWCNVPGYGTWIHVLYSCLIVGLLFFLMLAFLTKHDLLHGLVLVGVVTTAGMMSVIDAYLGLIFHSIVALTASALILAIEGVFLILVALGLRTALRN